jgi:uncharacterized protein (DUF362 family)
MDRKKIYVEYNAESQYPGAEDAFSPSIRYPEYRFGTISATTNPIYDMVRSCFHHLGLDDEHYGTSEWNPLRDIIDLPEGGTVLVKPNFVKHMNPLGTLDCLVTHGSVVRAVLDYVIIALNAGNRLVVGDAPVQTCDYEELMKAAHYDSIMEFYARQEIDVRFVDFRGTVSKTGRAGVIFQENANEEKPSILVNMAENSAFYNCGKEKNLRIANYSKKEVYSHHHDHTHEYLIYADALHADVIINLPKPKTHRIAGMTGALKNIVGINVEKDYLPHHTMGAKSNNARGDEYPKANLLYTWHSKLNESIDWANGRKLFIVTFLLKFGLYAIAVIGKFFNSKDNHITAGCWYGNDTLWRTVSDLNRILLYADKEGHLRQKQQRTVFTLADMVVIGEGEGPLRPSPKTMHMIVAGFNSWDLDRLIS